MSVITSGASRPGRAQSCIALAKRLISDGYKPTQKELDDALLWAIAGPPAMRRHADSRSPYKDYGKSPMMAEYLRSLGANDPPSTPKR